MCWFSKGEVTVTSETVIVIGASGCAVTTSTIGANACAATATAIGANVCVATASAFGASACAATASAIMPVLWGGWKCVCWVNWKSLVRKNK